MTLVQVTIGDETTEFWFCEENEHNLIGLLSNMEAECKQGQHESPELVAGLVSYLLRSSESADELWSNVFGSEGESMEWWDAQHFKDGADWDKIGRVYMECCDPDDPTAMPISKEFGIYEVAQAFALAIVKGYRDACTGKRFTLNSVEEMDACSSDVVMQIAVLGDVVYG